MGLPVPLRCHNPPGYLFTVAITQALGSGSSAQLVDTGTQLSSAQASKMLLTPFLRKEIFLLQTLLCSVSDFLGRKVRHPQRVGLLTYLSTGDRVGTEPPRNQPWAPVLLRLDITIALG